MNGATRVLLVEDEESLRMAVSDALTAAGYLVTVAADGEEGLQRALQDAPDLILLDLMLPRMDGFTVLKRLREDQLSSPVIILSARGEEWDRLQGFEYGADDYIVKPFSVQEMLLRMRALLERTRGGVPGIKDLEKARFGVNQVDFQAYSILHDGQRVGLSRREMELLRFFMENEGRTVSRDQVLNAVWGVDEFPSHRTVDTHVLKLRKKIEVNPERPQHLRTVHGVGYQFLAQPDVTAGPAR